MVGLNFFRISSLPLIASHKIIEVLKYLVTVITSIITDRSLVHSYFLRLNLLSNKLKITSRLRRLRLLMVIEGEYDMIKKC